MKLLEILQKELEQFPDGTLYAVQDGDGEVKFGKHSQPTLGSYGVWQRHEEGNYPTILGLEFAEDWDSAIVTKDMWENTRVKQIIVNVEDLPIEEKQRVNKALAKITGTKEIPVNSSSAGWFFAPDGGKVTWGMPTSSYTSTHTSQQVLEMAGMTTKRKVRTDFNPEGEYRVDVSMCSEEEKKEVQQAFFDVGFPWVAGGHEYQHLHAAMYTNVSDNKNVTDYLMYNTDTKNCNMTAKEFLELVYEPENKGHVHADLMAQYAEDAKTTDEPWELWQLKDANGKWCDLTCNPSFETDLEYRRKPKTKLVHGVEVPDISFIPEHGESYYYPDIDHPSMYDDECYFHGSGDEMRIKGNRCYPYTEEGKQAAILHAKAWLGIAY